MRLDPARTAMVAIDMHRGHLDPSVATLPLAAGRCGPVIKRAAALFAALRERAVPIMNIYVRKVERVSGRLQNSVVHTVPSVSQFWTYKPEEFLKPIATIPLQALSIVEATTWPSRPPTLGTPPATRAAPRFLAP